MHSQTRSQNYKFSQGNNGFLYQQNLSFMGGLSNNVAAKRAILCEQFILRVTETYLAPRQGRPVSQ